MTDRCLTSGREAAITIATNDKNEKDEGED
jgi:hypothetical protein